MTNEQTTVLIVDDEPLMRQSLRQALELYGYQVLEASDRTSALRQIENRFINVALLDIHLTEGTGLDVLREIRQVSEDTQAIMITGDASLETAVGAMDLAAFAYIEKPVDMKKLLATVERAVEKQRQTLRLRKPIRSRIQS